MTESEQYDVGRRERGFLDLRGRKDALALGDDFVAHG